MFWWIFSVKDRNNEGFSCTRKLHKFTGAISKQFVFIFTHINQNFEVDLLKNFPYSELLKVNQKVFNLKSTAKYIFFFFFPLNREPGGTQVRQNIKTAYKQVISCQFLFVQRESLLKENPCFQTWYLSPQ